MAYEVTATLRRPQNFDDLIGQEFVAATLKNAINSGKIAHAYLFSGPRGCGKTSSARILAKALNCETGPSANFCGKCSSCVEITRGSSMDVIEIDGASNTSVNDIRQIKDEILFPPNSCRYKVYIIDEVHMLSTSAFNALLKTIEEPPPYVIFIFATTELHKVPATIKSRCQQFHFRLGSVEQIKDLLSKVAKDSNIQADNEALYWIAKESTGSFRDAYTLFDQVASFSEGHITYEKIRDTLGLVGIDYLNTLCEICVTGNAAEAFQKIDEILQAGISIEQFISNCADYFRCLLLIKTGITKESILGQGVSRFSHTVLDTWNKLQLERAISIFLQLYRDIRYSLNPRYELELAISRLCWLSSFVSAQDVKTAIEQAKNLLTNEHPTQLISNQKIVMPQNVVSQTHQEASNQDIINDDEIQLSAKFPPTGMQKENIHPFLYSGSLNTTQEKPSDQHAPSNQGIAPIQTIENLRDTAIKELSYSHEILSSALAQSYDWTETDNTITATVDSSFIFSQLQKDIPIINPLLSTLTKKSLKFKVELRKIEKLEAEIKTPPQAEILCDIFRGTITKHEKISNTGYQSIQQQVFSPQIENTDDFQNYIEDTDEF